MIRFDAMGKSIRGLAAVCLIAALAPGLPSPAAAQTPAPAAPGTPAAPAPTSQVADEQAIQANLDNVTLRDFVRFVSRFTGRNIVYREDVIPNIKVSVFSHTPITEPDLMAIFQEVLASANLAAIYRGDSLYILPDKQTRDLQHTLDPQGAGRGPGEELITTVYRLASSINSKSAEATLKPMASPAGLVMDVPQAQSVLIRDVRQRVDQMVRLLRSLESMQPKYKLNVITMQKAKAEAAARKIQELYKQLMERGRDTDLPLVVPVEWSNSLIVSGTDAQVESVRALVAQMDQIGEGASVMRVFRLQNAKAESAAKVLDGLVQGAKAGGGGGGDQAAAAAVPKSGPFQVSADPNTNSLVVIGDNEFMTRVEDIIAKLDQPLDQVYVQALIMETTLTNANQFGVEWLVGGGESRTAAFGGFLDPTSSALQTNVLGPVLDQSGSPSLPGGFSLGVLGNVITYEGQRFPTLGALISFLKSANGINILSAPQIMTLDNAEAEVFVGENRPFLTSDRSETNNTVANVQSYDYRDVGIRLKVVPHINSESGLIRLDVQQEVKQISSATSSSTNYRPITLNRSTKTAVQLLDGATMVISGLMQNNSSQGRSAVPGAGDVPVLGWLFKSKNDSYSKTTLMVFLTARIIKTQNQINSLSQDKMEDQDAFQQGTKEFLKKEYGDTIFDPKQPEMLSPRSVIDAFQRAPEAPRSAPPQAPLETPAAP